MTTTVATNYDERDYPKVALHSGLKADWMHWSEMTLSVFERKGMTVLIEQLDSAEDVPMHRFRQVSRWTVTTSPN